MTKLKEFETDASALTAALDKLLEVRAKSSVTDRLEAAAGRPNELTAAWTNAAMFLKSDAFFKLGVLNGRDLSVLEGALSSPSTLLGATVTDQTARKQVDLLKDLLHTKLSTAREQFGGQKPAAPAQSGGMPSVNSLDEAQKLAPGTRYRTPDGRIFQR